MWCMQAAETLRPLRLRGMGSMCKHFLEQLKNHAMAVKHALNAN